MKVLVTGVAGYIGSVLAEMLLAEGCEVVGIDNLIHGSGESLLPLMPLNGFTFIKGDVYDIDEYKKYITPDTYVVHLAAIVGEPASRKYPGETKRTNLEATRRLMDYAAEVGVKKFVFVSTCSNYGKVKEGEYATEDYELNPLSLYAETKVQMERYLIEEVKDGMNWTILRFATVYGLSPRMRFDLTVNHFTKDAVLKGFLDVYLPYSNRPYVHVRDAARGVVLVLQKVEESRGEIFNVGDTSENYRKIDIVEEVKKLVPSLKVEFVEKGTDPRDYKVSFEKIKSRLGYHITRRVPDGVREVYRAVSEGWFRDIESRFYRNV